MYFTDVSINIWIVLLAGIASMVVGFLYYSPLLFGKPWMREMGFTPEKMAAMRKEKNMGRIYGLSFLVSLVTAYVLAIVLSLLGVVEVAEAIKVGVFCWVGFVAPMKFTDVLFAGKSRTLFALDAGYQLVSLIAMSIVFAYWL